jgi:N-acetylmuramate 1-kinase
MLSLFLADEAATTELGEDLALAAKAGDCFCLKGDLGAGKSTLARGFLRTMAKDPDLDVPSPTFTLVQSYDLRIPVAHFDFYRLSDPAELDELGLDEALDTGIVLAEWPEKGGDRLPKDRIDLAFETEGTGRKLVITGPDAALARIRRSLLIRSFLNDRGYAKVQRHHLTGDASSRCYERVTREDGQGLVLMDSPRQPDGPPIRDGKSYSQIAHLAEDIYPFVAIGRYLKFRGFAAPEIYETDFENGLMLIEDLGPDGVLDGDGRPIPERYLESVAALALLHGQPPQRDIPVTDTYTHVIADYDRIVMRMETDLLLDWHYPWKQGFVASDDVRSDYAAIWDNLIDQLAKAEQSLVLRDFHSPNIIWRENQTGLDRVGIIDFQDAMIGPAAYDVVSIVQDARVTVERDLVDAMLAHYCDLRRQSGPFDDDSFRAAFAIMSAQRACKLNGLWVRLMQRDQKPHYMKHMPRTLWHLQVAFEHEALRPLRDWCIKAGII